MAFLTWSDQYKVNVANIDAQHRKLFDMVNEMHDAMRVGKGNEVIGTILANLLGYVKTHFAEEERLMSSNGYPDFSRHKQEHDKLTQKALDLHKQFTEGKPVLSFDVMNFLKSWLSDHILGTDKKYGPFLNGKGIK
ncbi:MAG: bacteriohemerythrin [Alphaproteobacteria bacterium]|uniref:Bacteriohemerythrin n=1 Tax=Candidatus Nitrobium versatile TaxID=2884831 RepID=A0A953LVZ0_9BACT|nr:bacteriohemerythrin [Candidatus Nitrobium versatile]